MAVFKLTDFIMYNSYNNITGVSWEVCVDDDFKVLVDSTYNNKDTLRWFSRLDRPNGGQYNYNDKLYVRCKVHVDTSSTKFESKWFTKTINDLDKIRTVYIQDKNKIVGEIDIHPDGTKQQIW